MTLRMFVRPIAALVSLAAPALADPVADFYRDKTIDIIIGAPTGNDFDMRGRVLARHMGKFIPGNPQIVVRNMPGGGGVVAMNYLASRPVQDGTHLHMMFPNMGALQATGEPGVAFDIRKFFFIGNTTDSQNVMTAWRASGVTSIEDAKRRDVTLGASPGNTGIYYARALNQMIGTRFKIISGYPGGNEINLAMERGEVDGRASITWAGWKSTKPNWLRENLLIQLLQAGATKNPELPDTPLLHALATNADDRALLEFLSASVSIARALVASPGVPAERVEALRRAFDAAMTSPDLLAETGKMDMDISPTTGETSQRISDAIVNAPAPVVARAKAIMTGN
mgnify:CR=1 FL=1